jgi:hypothetical protein
MLNLTPPQELKLTNPASLRLVMPALCEDGTVKLQLSRRLSM